MTNNKRSVTKLIYVIEKYRELQTETHFFVIYVNWKYIIHTRTYMRTHSLTFQPFSQHLGIRGDDYECCEVLWVLFGLLQKS